MEKYVFEIEISGNNDIDATSKEDAINAMERKIEGFQEQLEQVAECWMISSKCVGTRNEDGAITYFE